jgi:hypothetical protein
MPLGPVLFKLTLLAAFTSNDLLAFEPIELYFTTALCGSISPAVTLIRPNSAFNLDPS